MTHGRPLPTYLLALVLIALTLTAAAAPDARAATTVAVTSDAASVMEGVQPTITVAGHADTLLLLYVYVEPTGKPCGTGPMYWDNYGVYPTYNGDNVNGDFSRSTRVNLWADRRRDDLRLPRGQLDELDRRQGADDDHRPPPDGDHRAFRPQRPDRGQPDEPHGQRHDGGQGSRLPPACRRRRLRHLPRRQPLQRHPRQHRPAPLGRPGRLQLVDELGAAGRRALHALRLRHR